MMVFESLARQHWKKYLPGMVRELEKEGRLEEEITLAADRARAELVRMVQRGAQLETAKAIVLEEYILLEPETADNDSIDTPDEED